MAVALVIEDGTGVASANSWVTRAEVQTYVDTYYPSHTEWTAATDDAKDEAIVKAAQYLELVYGTRWRGRKVARDQAMHWPRYDVYDNDGYLRSYEAIPTKLKDAQCEVTLRAVAGTTLLVDISAGADPALTSKRVKAGPIETEKKYAGATSTHPVFDTVNYSLRELIRAGSAVERG